jgi:hypothetical protein
MELLRQYIEGLNAVIHAGVDVRAPLFGMMQAVILVEIDEEKKDLLVTYINNRSPHDKTAHLPVSTKFSMEFNDLPNQLRGEGWK